MFAWKGIIPRDLQQTQNQCLLGKVEYQEIYSKHKISVCLERFTQCVIFTHHETGIASLGNDNATENSCSGYQLIKLLTVYYHL